jgi:HEPN domain-containing protein
MTPASASGLRRTAAPGVKIKEFATCLVMSFEEAELLRLRAEAFLRNAERLYAEGEYDLAAFSIEQHCQLMLKYKLLLKTGAYPRTHSLIRLVRELAKVAEGAKRLLEDIVMLTKIEDAYIGSRYLPRRYEKEEVEAMLKYVKEKFRPVIDEL